MNRQHHPHHNIQVYYNHNPANDYALKKQPFPNHERVSTASHLLPPLKMKLNDDDHRHNVKVSTTYTVTSVPQKVVFPSSSCSAVVNNFNPLNIRSVPTTTTTTMKMTSTAAANRNNYHTSSSRTTNNTAAAPLQEYFKNGHHFINTNYTTTVNNSTCPSRNSTVTTSSYSTHQSSNNINNYMLSKEARTLLKNWMFAPEHFSHPYPTEKEKIYLARAAKITTKQLSNWFTNARKRLWQPVLKRMGIDVKRFLSTGRGGCREGLPIIRVPPNLHEIVASLSSENNKNYTASTNEESNAVKTLVTGFK